MGIPHDVFISYSSRDKPIADAICAGLEAAKIRCWIAPRDVLPGVPYGEALGEALRDSQILLLVFSSNSNRSPQVMREVENAVDKGIPILPFRIENVQPSASLDYFVKAIHWLDAITPPLEQHLASLAETIRLLLMRQQRADIAEGQPAAPTSALSAIAAMPSLPAASKRRKGSKFAAGYMMATALLVVVVVGLVVLAGWWSRVGAHNNDDPGHAAQQNEDQPPPLKTFHRKAFKFDYPTSWTVDENDKDYDPDHMFSIDASKGAMVMFVIFEAENDPFTTLSTMVKAQEKQISGATKTEFKRWGRYDGAGVTLQGKVQGVIKSTLRVFVFNASKKTFVITEQMPDDERQQLLAGYRAVEESFQVTK